MSNELKVNAKTDNLEFKRKHNKLVEVVKGNCPKSEIPGFQGTTVIARNALTNVNGWELTSFKAVDGTYAGYAIKTILENTEEETILTEERAKVYLKAMTGSEFLPKYDYNLPQNSYLIFSDGTIWKPQFDETNGLRLFKMFEMPSGGTKLYKHSVSIQSIEDSDFNTIAEFVSLRSSQYSMSDVSKLNAECIQGIKFGNGQVPFKFICYGETAGGTEYIVFFKYNIAEEGSTNPTIVPLGTGPDSYKKFRIITDTVTEL